MITYIVKETKISRYFLKDEVEIDNHLQQNYF